MMRIAALYGLLALVSTLVNLGSQMVSIAMYSDRYGVLLSVLVGTAVGLLTKYVLDKRYIFRYKARDLGHDSRVFALYAAMGVLTTTIFWAVEFGFDALFHSAAMRYLGGAIGLAIGYLVKYHLDRKYVFVGNGDLSACRRG
ncbi:MAG: hypothetical protein JWQ20_4426 [Conexibacter sp.]|nr:hypothetical protein [Conexibacter sp.]